MADTRLLVGLVLSLLISSLCISFITDTEAAELGNTVLYKPVDLDFRDDNITELYAVKAYEVVTGGWTPTDNGLTSSAAGENVIYLLVMSAGSGRFDNHYALHNPDGRDYKIVVRDTSLWSDSLRLKVSRGSVTLESKSFFGSYAYQATKAVNVYSYGTDYTVRTLLNEVDRTVDVWINDNYVGQFINIPEDGALSFGPSTYAGVVVDGAGMTFKGFVSSGERLDSENFDVWTFLNSLAGVLAWYTGTGVPIVDLFINLIIKVQQFGIIVVIVTIIRGN